MGVILCSRRPLLARIIAKIRDYGATEIYSRHIIGNYYFRAIRVGQNLITAITVKRAYKRSDVGAVGIKTLLQRGNLTWAFDPDLW